MASGGRDAENRPISSIPKCWTRLCITLNGSSKDLPFPQLLLVQFLLHKHGERICQSLREKRYKDVEILLDKQSLCLNTNDPKFDEDEVHFDLDTFFKSELKDCKQKEVSVPKDIEGILSGWNIHSSADLGIYHNTAAREIIIVSFEKEKVDRIAEWVVKKLRNPNLEQSVSHELSVSKEQFHELKIMGFLDDCDEKIEKVIKSVYMQDEKLFIPGTKEDAESLDKKFSKMLSEVKDLETEILSSEAEVLSFPEVKSKVDEKLQKQELNHVLWKVSEHGKKFYINIRSKSKELNKRAKEVVKSSITSIPISEEGKHTPELKKLVEEYQGKKLVLSGSDCYTTVEVIEEMKKLKETKPHRDVTEFSIEHCVGLLLEKEKAKEYVEKKLMDAGITCQFQVYLQKSQYMLKLIMKGGTDVENAKNVIKKCWRHWAYSNTFSKLESNPVWKALNEKHKGKWIVDGLELDEFSVCCTDDIYNEIFHEIENIGEKKCLKMKVEGQKYKYMKENLEDKVSKIAARNDVFINNTDAFQCFTITGKENNANQALIDLKLLLESIETEEIEIIPELIDVFSKEEKADEDFQCMLQERCGIYVEKELQKAQPHHLRDWVNVKDHPFHICVLKGSPTKAVADMIVAPTNDSFFPIEDGEEIFLEGGNVLEDILTAVNFKKCGLGDHYIFSETGNLKFQHIGCLCTSYNNTQSSKGGKDDDLCSWILKLLEDADKKGIQSLVIPVRLTNLLIPDVLWDEIAKALNMVRLMENITNLCEVYVCVTEDKDCEGVLQAFEDVLKESTMAMCDFQCLVPQLREKFDEKDQKNPIQTKVLKGYLQSEKVDVIVNAVSPDLDLSKGLISKKILDIAGEKLQEELNSKPTPLEIGGVVHSKSWNMKTCKAICHAVLPNWTPCTDFSLRVVKCVMWQSLWYGHSNNFSSIAFPALGCGNLKYPPSSLANAMMDCVEEFGLEHPDTSIRTVKFVIYPTDEYILKWFESARMKASHSISRKSLLPPKILECRKSTRNGAVKIQTFYTKGNLRNTSLLGCDAVFKFQPVQTGSKALSAKWMDDAVVGTLMLDVRDVKNSFINALEEILTYAGTHRLTSIAICIEDLEQIESETWTVQEQLNAIWKTFLEGIITKRKKYIQVIRVVLKDVSHAKLLKEAEAPKVKQGKNSKWHYLSRFVKVTAKQISNMLNNEPENSPDWKVVKPVDRKMRTEKLMTLVLVGKKEAVERAKMKILEIERHFPETVMILWKYLKPTGIYSETVYLPKEICDKLNIACILKKDLVTLDTQTDTPCLFDLKAMKCSLGEGKIKFDMIKESPKGLEKDQEDQVYDDIEIFETVTGDINHCFIQEDSIADVRKVLQEYGLKQEETTKAGIISLQITGPFCQVLKANECLLNNSDKSQSPYRKKENSMSFENIVDKNARKIDFIYYKAMEFFCKHEETWKTLDIQWHDGQLIFQKKKADDDKYVDNLIERILAMKREDINIPSKDKVENVLKLCDDEPDIYTSFDKNKLLLTIFGENYSHFLTLQQKIQYQLQEKKPRLDRRKRFAADNDLAKSQSDRSKRFGVDDEREDSDIQRAPSYSHASVREFCTQENIKVKVYCASIMSIDVDCIVNAANENLQHGAGVAFAISNAAGYTLDQEGNDYIRRNGPLKVGTCCSTTAGNLTRYSCVIHTVGPRWSSFIDKNECRQVLRRSIFVCLVEASDRRLSSIGIPSISAGIFGVPKEVCAEEYFYAVSEFSVQYASSTTLKEIHFIDRDDQMIGLIGRVFQSGFDGKLRTSSQNSSHRSFSSSVSKKTGSFSQKISGSVDHSIFVANEKIKVHVLKKDIVAMAVDGIVCPQDIDFRGRSQIAKSVYNKASEKYKNDLDEIEWRPLIGESKTFDTHGSMPFRYVIHAVIQRWDKTYNASFQSNLEKAIKNIFSTANSKGMKSLAIPLLGISSDGVDEPTKIFGNLLKKCIKTQFSPTIEDIYIVCFEDSGHGIKIIQDLFSEDVSFRKEKFDNTDTTSDEKSLFGKTLRGESGVKEDCCICMDTCTEPKRLPCGHIFCKECIDMHFTYKPTCPSCNKVFGKLFGNQPDGNIRFKRHQTDLPGYKRCGTIEVIYNIYSGTQQEDHPNPGQPFDGIRRSGLLPDNEDGRLVAKLLNVAFSRKLTFTIGRSRTTEKEGVVTWNDIHHKTRREGGPERFGYPDSTYLSRVLEELSAKGVTLESADNPKEYREYTYMS